MLVGWGLLFVAHFLASVSVTIQAYKRMDTTVSAVLVACFALVLTALFFIAMSLLKLKDKSSPTQASTKLTLSREIRERLNRFYELVVADICLLYIVLFAFKIRFEHLFPIYVDRVNEYGKAELKWVRVSDPHNLIFLQKSYADFFRPFFGEITTRYIQHGLVYGQYGLTWVVGGAQLAALGISGYLVFLSNDLYKSVLALM